MFNQTFIFLATLFGAKIKCVKEHVRGYPQGRSFVVIGVINSSDGVYVFLRDEKTLSESKEPISLIEKCFALCSGS